MISDERVERALEFLIKSASDLADARAVLVGLEEGRKSMKAKLMKSSEAKSNDMREADAYDSDEYRTVVAGLVEATRRAERLRLDRENAMTCIEVWRTAQANQRAQERIR